MTLALAAAAKNTKNAAERTCKIMKTILRKVDPQQPDAAIIAEGAEILKRGGLVAFPTETVYGLGGNGLDSEACQKAVLPTIL